MAADDPRPSFYELLFPLLKLPSFRRMPSGSRPDGGPREQCGISLGMAPQPGRGGPIYSPLHWRRRTHHRHLWQGDLSQPDGRKNDWVVLEGGIGAHSWRGDENHRRCDTGTLSKPDRKSTRLN